MKIICRYIIILCLSGFAACMAAKNRKTASYYRENKEEIEALRKTYDQLYNHQPFSAGFTDKSFRYYVMEVTTDSLRYIFNSEKNRRQLGEVIKRFQYDTTALRNLSNMLSDTKCLWLSKSSFYVDGQRETVTYLSFNSATTESPFVENKYYILIFLPHPITHPDIKKRIQKGDLIKIDELVYYTIGNRYR
ncbi:hypothetical protein [Pollutibacter soli]|uniref:hypothetical protein n=1 Tax=Pollutibacter soli TaxID=3034157 RepID=UPI0030138F8D